MCPRGPPRLQNVTELLKSRLTVAPLFFNGNNKRSKAQFIKIFKNASMKQNRQIHIVAGAGHSRHQMPFKVASFHTVPKTNAFDASHQSLRTRDFLNQFFPGDIVLCMVGPLGRVLVSEWTNLRSDMTFIDFGSFWDTELWGRKIYTSFPTSQLIDCMFKGDVMSSGIVAARKPSI